MKSFNYKVLITTSGTGSRLGELTKTTNKALVQINGKPTIEYIFDSYSKNTTFVITLGYFGEQVRNFLTKNYPEHVFEFVEVDKYVGEGSSLLYSIKCAQENLQCPFIFHACDTIVLEKIPEPKEDWVIGYVVDDASMNTKQYRTHQVNNGYVTKVNDKGVTPFDSIHIGMTGICNYEKFWTALNEIYENDPLNQTLGDITIIEKLLEEGISFKWIPFKTWLDTGNVNSFNDSANYLTNSK